MPPRTGLRIAGSLDGLWAALDAWGNYLAARGVADSTREGYEGALLRFFRRTRLSPESVKPEHVDAFLAQINPKGPAAGLYVRALRSFYSWAVRRGILEHNPVEDIRPKAPKYPPARSLSEEEFTRICIAAAWRHPRRAWAIVLLLETGARIGSLAAVRPGDVGDRGGELIHFSVAKGDRPYAVPLSELAAEAVRELRRWEGETLLGVHKVTLWRWFHEAAVDAGLPPGKRHPHMARHTAATNLLRRTKNVRLVQEFLNHADLSQMHRYVAVTDEEMRRAVGRSSFG